MGLCPSVGPVRKSESGRNAEKPRKAFEFMHMGKFEDLSSHS